MSHVTSIEVVILDLASLKAACADLGLEFKENQTKYKWYGSHVGDYPVPAGFKVDDLGKCLHAIGIPNNKDAYEIGVVKNPNGKGYVLLWDFWAGGMGLQQVVGKDCKNLTHAYKTNQTVKSFQKRGFTVAKKIVNPKTKAVQLVLRKQK